MSNTIAHLTVANRILREVPALVQNADAFYLGSVAPDTIGSKVGCLREDKKRVHLREEIRDADWLNTDKIAMFKSRIQEFVNQHILEETGDQRDFNIGYLVHLLTDEWNHRTIRQTMLKIANAMNVLESDREFFHMMTNDLEALDNYLLSENAEVQQILSCVLTNPVEYSLPGYIERAYIEGSAQWWKNAYLPNITQRELKYITEEDIDNFISVATENIIAELKTQL